MLIINGTIIFGSRKKVKSIKKKGLVQIVLEKVLGYLDFAENSNFIEGSTEVALRVCCDVNLQEKYPWWSSNLINLQHLALQINYSSTLPHEFSYEISKIFQNNILIEHLWASAFGK